MADKSRIEWTDATWNPITGCTKVSPGCKFCYAERFAIRGMGQFAKDPKRKFTDIEFHPDKLMDPIRWKKPRMIFVCSMADLFHPDVPFAQIDKIFDIMYKAEQHIFQILTKRPEIMYKYYKRFDLKQTGWKQKNIWLGVSVENQRAADERIPILLKIPAYIRFLSVEPLLAPVDLAPIYLDDERYNETGTINWVIAGGESGPKARPMHSNWVRSIRDQCQFARIPFFFKQWGEWADVTHVDDRQIFDRARFRMVGFHPMFKVGKKDAGRLLDGREWNEYPDYINEHFGYYGHE